MRLLPITAIAALLITMLGCGPLKAVMMNDLLLPDGQFRPGGRNPEAPLLFGDQDARMRSWGGYMQRVHRLADPAAAKAEQDHAPYGRVIVDDENPYGPIVPLSLSGVRLNGNSPALMCAGRGKDLEESCPFWQFRERFGAYLVDVDFSRNYDPQRRSIPKTEFLALVQAIDRHIHKVLH